MGVGCSSDASCFAMLQQRRRRTLRAEAVGQFADVSPQSQFLRPSNSPTLEKALAAQHLLPANWATPVPMYSPVPVIGEDDLADVEFDMSMDEPDNSAARSTSGSIPRRKTGRMLDAGVMKSFHQVAHKLQMKGKSAGDILKSSFGMEQLLASPGSLPAGMSLAERESFSRQTTPSGAYELISSIPRELLTAKGPDGQRLRLKLLTKTTIVFFTAGYEGKRFVYERAAALGVKSVIIDSPDSWSKQLVADGIISKFIPIDMTLNSEEVYRAAVEAIASLGNDGGDEADAVATVVELSVPTACRLAEAFGLPGHRPDAVDKARDKRCTRQALREAGLPTPAFARICSDADLEGAATTVGFPAVLKPVSGAASLGVKKVSSKADLYEAYAEVDKELRSLVVSSGALVKDDGQGNGVQADGVIGTTFILEQYLDGDEVDVDVVMSEGDWRYAAVSDNGPTLEPYFNETWAVSPSLLPRTKQQELRQLAVDSVKALGFTDGVFHVECKYTTKGPHLIEVNARMGGGPVHATNRRTWNVDLVDETLLAAVGIPSRPDVPRQPLECIANSDVNTLRSGTLKNLHFLEPLKDRPGVVSFSPHVRAGEKVVGPSDGLPTWLVEIVVSRPTPEEALKFLMDLEAEVQAKVELI